MQKGESMKLIDADALRDRLQNLGYNDWNQGATTTWAEAFKECADMVEEMPTIEPEIVRCKDCEYGKQDEYGRWYCRGLGCQIGNEDGSGFCSDAERKNNV